MKLLKWKMMCACCVDVCLFVCVSVWLARLNATKKKCFFHCWWMFVDGWVGNDDDDGDDTSTYSKSAYINTDQWNGKHILCIYNNNQNKEKNKIK